MFPLFRRAGLYLRLSLNMLSWKRWVNLKIGPNAIILDKEIAQPSENPALGFAGTLTASDSLRETCASFIACIQWRPWNLSSSGFLPAETCSYFFSPRRDLVCLSVGSDSWGCGLCIPADLACVPALASPRRTDSDDLVTTHEPHVQSGRCHHFSSSGHCDIERSKSL